VSVVANVAINVDSRGAVGQLKAVQTQAQLTERAFGGLKQAIGALGVGFALSKVISDVKELDTNLRRLTTVGVNVAKISPALAKLSDELGGVANKAELAAASYQAASAGFSDTAGNINILRAATKAAAGGLADTSAVTEVLVKTLNAYGMSGNQAIQVTDSISKAVELGNQEWSDYTSQLGRVASIAALAGVSLDEVNAFIASATKNGATAEIAFTGLGATLNTLLQPTKESQEAAAKLGLQWNYGALQAKGFAGLMAELAVATEKDKEATARLLGSQEAMRGAMAASSKGGTDFKNILEQLGNAAGKTDTDFQTMKGSLENTLKALDTSFKNLSESLGKAFGPTLVIVIQDITKAVNGFANVMNAIPQPVMNAVGGLAKFVVQMLLVQKAIQAIIALRAAYVAAMAGMAAATVASGAAATTSAGAFALYTSNARTLQAASILATGSVSGLAGALLALAGIGIVTVGVNYVVTQVGDIIGSSTAAGKSVTAGTKAGLQAQLKGKSEADRKKMLATAQKNLQNDKKLASQLQLQIQRQDNLASSAGEGALPSERSKLTQIQARINTNQARIKAIQTLPITQATPPKPQLPPPTGAIPPADGGGGAGAKPKEKEIKAAKQILDISKEESTLRAQLALYTAQEDLYAQALLTKELAIFKAKQDQIGPNERKLQMFEAEVTYVKTINDLEKEKTDKLKSQNELNQQKMQPLQDELAIMQARLAGNEAEVMLRIQIRDIMAGTAGLSQQDVTNTLNQINATKQLLTEKEKIANLVQNIGSSIESGIVGAIDGAITGAKSLQESLADVLKDIGRMLISFGIKSLLGGIDIGGTKIFGGGRAAGGPVSSNSTYMVGEKGPELFVPSSSGTIIPADATAAAMARYQRQGSGSGVSGSGSDAMGVGEATPVLSMSFETTRFMDRDWVDKDQLVAAMAATERRATTAGAKAGAAQVSSQMRNSPGYRRQVGLR
jgi:TP901 family phage tail tape measure protein